MQPEFSSMSTLNDPTKVRSKQTIRVCTGKAPRKQLASWRLVCRRRELHEEDGRHAANEKLNDSHRQLPDRERASVWCNLVATAQGKLSVPDVIEGLQKAAHEWRLAKFPLALEKHESFDSGNAALRECYELLASTFHETLHAVLHNMVFPKECIRREFDGRHIWRMVHCGRTAGVMVWRVHAHGATTATLDHSVFEVLVIAVSDKYGRCGVASAMVAALEESAGCGWTMYASVGEDQPLAARFWEKNGFRQLTSEEVVANEPPPIDDGAHVLPKVCIPPERMRAFGRMCLEFEGGVPYGKSAQYVQ